VRGDAEGDALQQMIANYLRVPNPNQAIVAPIMLGPKVINLICVQTSETFNDNASAELQQIAAQAAAAYRRVILKKRGS
jgi:transcriptional regulator with GAF, ATPase, and Fis domain